MALHRELWKRFKAATRGEKVQALGVNGSVNYRHMDRATAALVDPSPANLAAFVELLHRQEVIGHLSLEGPHGVACEQGAPGMHWSFNEAPVLGVLRLADERHLDELAEACMRHLVNEVGLDTAYRFNGTTVVPCPRVKDEKNEAPIDGYRDKMVALAIGEAVRAGKWLSDDDAMAPRLMAEMIGKHHDRVARFRAAKVPLLYIPIERVDLEGGGYSARLVDSAAARKSLGKDACHRVRIGPGGVAWWVDFEEGEPAGKVAW